MNYKLEVKEEAKDKITEVFQYYIDVSDLNLASRFIYEVIEASVIIYALFPTKDDPFKKP